jgi:hypothetical protein
MVVELVCHHALLREEFGFGSLQKEALRSFLPKRERESNRRREKYVVRTQIVLR